MASIPGLIILLVVVWIVVEMVYRFVRTDSLHYDMQYLWDRYDIPQEQYRHDSNQKIGPSM